MKVLIAGGSGLVGTALSEALRAEGHTVSPMVRSGGRAQQGSVEWDPSKGTADLAAMEGMDAAVCLSGANIGERRWSAGRKKLLRTSRVDSTSVFVESLGKLSRKPRVFIGSSAVGIYGNRGDEMLTESSAPGSDFLSSLVRDWEAEAMRAEKSGIRTVIARFGVVLSSAGGALPRMLLPFRLGAGGRLGSGKQWMSWAALDDAVKILRFAMTNEGVRGPVNVVAPTPVQNVEFTRVLAKVLRRPAIFPAPAFMLRLALGEMADALLLSSQRAIPERLRSAGFEFRFSDLEAALTAILRGKN
jgi:uncharacterized protein